MSDKKKHFKFFEVLRLEDLVLNFMPVDRVVAANKPLDNNWHPTKPPFTLPHPPHLPSSPLKERSQQKNNCESSKTDDFICNLSVLVSVLSSCDDILVTSLYWICTHIYVIWLLLVYVPYFLPEAFYIICYIFNYFVGCVLWDSEWNVGSKWVTN